MTFKEFWNLAGRAGRIGHDSVGVIGLAAGSEPNQIAEYVSINTGELVSRLVDMLNKLDNAGRLNDLSSVIEEDQWVDFRCYIAHLWNEKKNLDAVLTDTEQILRNTYGYGVLRSSQDGQRKARVLLDATRKYAMKLAENPGHTELADMTGFSPEGVAKALAGFNQLEHKLSISDWSPQSLFGHGRGLADLFGIMLRVPQLADSLTEIGGAGQIKTHIADMTFAWVSGKSIQEIAKSYFEGNETDAITQACKAIYKNIVNAGTWGLSALSRMSGIDFSSLSESERRQVNVLPAMIYHGVRTEEAVLMRMNAAPRSVAENLGEEFRSNLGKEVSKANVSKAREFIKALSDNDWDRIKPASSALSGNDYINQSIKYFSKKAISCYTQLRQQGDKHGRECRFS